MGAGADLLAPGGPQGCKKFEIGAVDI